MEVPRRMLVMAAVVAGASLLGAFCFLAGGLLVAVLEFGTVPGDVFTDVVKRLPWMWLAPMASGWAVLYGAAVFATGAYFIQADEVGPRSIGFCIALLGLFCALAQGPPSWFGASGAGVRNPAESLMILRGMALGVWLGSSTAIGFLARLLRQRQMTQLKMHSMARAVEREAERREREERWAAASEENRSGHPEAGNPDISWRD